MACGDCAPSSDSTGGNGPTITASATPPQLLVTGRGFRPRCRVTVRVIDPDQTTTYFQYTADVAGDLTATLPTVIPHGAVHISATDRRPDAGDETGVRWTNTDTVTW